MAFAFVMVYFSTDNQQTQEFSKNISMILIPIIAGGITTKFTTNSWQINKEKMAIKQNILLDYTESYKKMSILHDNFMFNVIENYVIFTNNNSEKPFHAYSRKKFNINAFLPQSIEQTMLPKEKCKNEYMQLQKSLHIASIIQNQLFSKIRLYFDDTDLEIQINELKELIDDQAIIIQRFMNSSNIDEIEKFFNIYVDTIGTIIDKFKKVELTMVNLKFRKIIL